MAGLQVRRDRQPRQSATPPERVADGFAVICCSAYLLRPIVHQIQRWSLARIREIANESGPALPRQPIVSSNSTCCPACWSATASAGDVGLRCTLCSTSLFPKPILITTARHSICCSGQQTELAAPSLVDAMHVRSIRRRQYQLHEQTYKVRREVITLVLPAGRCLTECGRHAEPSPTYRHANRARPLMPKADGVRTRGSIMVAAPQAPVESLVESYIQSFSLSAAQ
jgi:hypothetical protein